MDILLHIKVFLAFLFLIGISMLAEACPGKLSFGIQAPKLESIDSDASLLSTLKAKKDDPDRREFWVRLRNQIRFSFFRKSSVKTTFVGKRKVLYQPNYLASYLGQNYMGRQEIAQFVHKMKLVQDVLEEDGKIFIYALAPGKVYIYPEYLPDTVNLSKKDTTNYEVYLDELERQGVHHIDLIDYFKHLKDTCEHPLYPRGGIHWSGYSTLLAMDTLISYVEMVSGKNLLDYNLLPGERTRKNLRFTDQDLEKHQNLLFNVRDWKMCYPEVQLCQSKAFYRPTLLNIGDSYNMSFNGFYADLWQNVFSEQSRLYFYNKELKWGKRKDLTDPYLSVSTIPKELKKYDVILLLSTDPGLTQKGYRFIRDAYLSITEIGKQDEELRQERISEVIRKIRKDKKWLESVKKKARENAVTIEEMIRRDATWVINREDEQRIK